MAPLLTYQNLFLPHLWNYIYSKQTKAFNNRYLNYLTNLADNISKKSIFIKGDMLSELNIFIVFLKGDSTAK